MWCSVESYPVNGVDQLTVTIFHGYTHSIMSISMKYTFVQYNIQIATKNVSYTYLQNTAHKILKEDTFNTYNQKYGAVKENKEKNLQFQYQIYK